VSGSETGEPGSRRWGIPGADSLLSLRNCLVPAFLYCCHIPPSMPLLHTLVILYAVPCYLRAMDRYIHNVHGRAWAQAGDVHEESAAESTGSSLVSPYRMSAGKMTRPASV
jgi:hypothetical protein